MDFFDKAFTFSSQMSNVTCCFPDNSLKVATCGKGASCAGQCSALGASLCPSSNCTNDPRTCQLDFDTDSTDARQRGNSDVTLSLSDLKYCTNTKHRCKVRKHNECCYNTNCLKRKGRKQTCKWLDFLTGKYPHFSVLRHSSRSEVSYSRHFAIWQVVM